jgi:cell division protein FtsL
MIAKSRKNKKGSYQEVFFSIFLVVLIILGAAFLIISNSKINKRRQELISQINKLEAEIKEKEKQNSELKAGVLQISDQNYLEQEAREKLGLKKPGEEVVSVQKAETETNANQEFKKETNSPWNPKTWWDWIKNKIH